MTGRGSHLGRGPLNVRRDPVQAQRRPLCAGHYAGDSLQQVSQVSRDGAGLVAVKFRKGLGLKILKHKEGIFPYKVHLEERQKASGSAVRESRASSAKGSLSFPTRVSEEQSSGPISLFFIEEVGELGLHFVSPCAKPEGGDVGP